MNPSSVKKSARISSQMSSVETLVALTRHDNLNIQEMQTIAKWSDHKNLKNSD